jgi:hypothetical protein
MSWSPGNWTKIKINIEDLINISNKRDMIHKYQVCGLNEEKHPQILTIY